jgi:hypothetical protein
VGLLRPPNVERYARIGHIDKLSEIARGKRWPEAAAQARRALEGRMDLLIDTLGNKNMRRVLTAREAMRVVGRPATKALLENIDDPRKERRQDVVHALGEMRDPYAVKALIGRLRDRDGLVRQLACRALAKIGDPRALPALRRVEAADLDGSVRKTAADAVRRIEKHSRTSATGSARRRGAGPVANEVPGRDENDGSAVDEAESGGADESAAGEDGDPERRY